MTRDIDPALLRAFLTVAETGGMTSAGRILNLTQGAVSQQIKRLEDLLRTPLFERRQKKVMLTGAGERLVNYARRMVSLNDEMWGLMTAPEFEGELRLGVPHDIVAAFMPGILRSFAQRWPRIRVTLVSDTTPTLLRAMDNGEIDLTLTTESAPAGELLLADDLVWIGAPGGKAYTARPLPVALGGETCSFRAAAVKALTDHNLDWHLMCQVGSLEPVCAILEADLAIAPFLAQTVPSNLAVVADKAGLPPLPTYYVNLRKPPIGGDEMTAELARHIQSGFAARYRNAA